MITHDFHVHLHGVLTAEDLWLIGKDTFTTHAARLQWYAQEYAQAWGRRPDWAAYWQHADGLALLSHDYEIKSRVSFQQFQACFNLIIALCPLREDNFSVQEQLIRKAGAAGLRYFEARTVLPPFFSSLQAGRYLTGLCQKVADLNHEGVTTTSLVFSLERSLTLRDQQYRLIRDFTRARPDLAGIISGLDFAGWEEDFPPTLQRGFIAHCFEENRSGHPLELLYHVGESFTTLSMASSLRWIYTLAHYGLRRIGHALVLGTNPRQFEGQSVWEEVGEFYAHQDWLSQEKDSLAALGYSAGQGAHFSAERERVGTRIKITYTPEYCEDISSLQRAIAAFLCQKNMIIESCPSSNSRIGASLSPEDNPLRFFIAQGIKVVLGSDDPGIFASDWQQEEALAAHLSGEREIFAKNAELLRSQTLFNPMR